MKIEKTKVSNPIYLWASRAAMLVTLFLTLPNFLLNQVESGSALGNAVTLLVYCYIIVGNYILGFRLDDPPKWSSWVVPNKWVEEWKYLVEAKPESIKSNRWGLLRVVAGTALVTFIVLATLAGKF